MTPQQLEALVLEAVQRATTRQPIEDDRIEMKRDWPTITKARQLAASCNRANGEWLIYVIGVDESDGTVHALSKTDPADWWAQMSSRFEGIAPDVVTHLNVPVGKDETVIAILFRTDRAPYVVKVGDGGSPELEVPIRDLTRTRSARRDELLRMLVPSSAVPSLLLLEADVTANWHAQSRGAECIQIMGGCRIYLEHIGGTTVLLPEHEMRIVLVAGGLELAPKIDFWRARHEPPPPPRFGVHVSADGVVASGPGSFSFNFFIEVDAAHESQIHPLESVDLKLEVGVAGSMRVARVAGILAKAKVERDVMPEQHRHVGHWALGAAWRPSE